MTRHEFTASVRAMSDRCQVFVPVGFFPSLEQLEPLCGDGFVTVNDFEETAEVRWKGVTLHLARVAAMETPGAVQGLLRFVEQQGGSAALRTRVLHQRSVYEVRVVPGFDADGRAMQVLAGLTDAADGLCRLGDALYAAGGRPLLTDAPLEPPEPERVRDRAHVLLALSMRGLLEQDAGTPDAAKAETLRAQLQDWVEEHLLNELEPEERAFLATEIGAADPQLVIDAVWRAEGAQVLLWALRARALPAHDAQEHPFVVAREAGVMAPLPPVLTSPSLRPIDELEGLQRRLLGLHWRIREQTVRPGPVEFVRFSQTAPFGPFHLDGVALVAGDLSVKGASISAASPEDSSLVRSIAHERHLAANWLIGVHESYTRVNTPT